jgi:hypothetical protein
LFRSASHLLFWVFAILVTIHLQAQHRDGYIRFEIFGDTLELSTPPGIQTSFEGPLSQQSIKAFYQNIKQSDYAPLVEALKDYRKEKQLNDWLYYQLVRRTAQQLAPKADNYYRYTMYKWFLMVSSGYDATLNVYNDQLLFYVYSPEEVYNLPLYEKEGKQYVCLNIHDYARATMKAPDTIFYVDLQVPGAIKPFSYRVTQLPEFAASLYADKNVEFPFRNRDYHFKLKVNPQMEQLFTNYPTVAFADYFNIPLSKPTYQSLVPVLKENLKKLNVKKGVEYLMKFTRYAFLYEDDQDNFGKEKRMGPEQTLLSSASDCDDRAALFFYLVKEIYNLPMIAVVYSDHITVAVQFNKAYGNAIIHDGRAYSICEPTPQKVDLAIGQIAPHYRNQSYQVVYAYDPK